MPNIENPNILFRFSGIYGDYTFPQNPESMDVMSPFQHSNVVQTLEQEDIYMRGFIDNEVRVMKWSDVQYATYSGMKQWSVRDNLGAIPVVQFWDGTVNEFQGARIQVIDVFAQPMAGKFNRWSMELQFKPVKWW
jgi:hypothetical protein